MNLCTSNTTQFDVILPQGKLIVNGVPIDEVRNWYVANTGYVLQLATPYYEELTVRENITLAAQMRLPKGLSLEERFERVERVMREVKVVGGFTMTIISLLVVHLACVS